MAFRPGDELRITMVFTDQTTSEETDPTTVALSWQDEAGSATKTTKALADLTKDSTGNYHYDIDTTDFTAGSWIVQCVATGAVAAVDVETFVIQALPL